MTENRYEYTSLNNNFTNDKLPFIIFFVISLTERILRAILKTYFALKGQTISETVSEVAASIQSIGLYLTILQFNAW